MSSLKSYYKEGIDNLKNYSKKAIKANNEATDKYISQTNGIYDAAAKQLGTNAAQNKEKLNQDYQSAYDLNAVNKLVAERQLKEKMANSGLSDSGLNRSQLTAIATQKMNADNAVNQKKSAAKSSIEQGLASALQQNEASRTSAISSAQLTNAQNNANIKNSMYKSAYESAVSRLNADTEANAKVKAAQIEAEANRIAAAEKAAAEAEITNEKIFSYAQKLYNTDKTNGGDMTFEEALSSAERYLIGDTAETNRNHIDFSNWTAYEIEDYFSTIGETEGEEAAQIEYDNLVKQNRIPENLKVFAMKGVTKFRLPGITQK